MSEDVEMPGLDVVPQDPGWPERRLRRLQAGLEVLADSREVLSYSELLRLASERVPMQAYDLSVTKSGGQRGDINFGWNLTTVWTHAGWVHVTPAGVRATAEGQHVVALRQAPEELFEQGVSEYRRWDALRKEALPDRAGDPTEQVLRRGPGAAHALLVADQVLAAWRTGGSAFGLAEPVWSAGPASELLTYLEAAEGKVAWTLPGPLSLAARVLAAEALALLAAPFADVSGATKRSRVRSPLLDPIAPPAIPLEISAHLEQGFVTGGKTVLADPTALLRSVAAVVLTLDGLTAEELGRMWSDPWAWRDLVAGLPQVDERVAALLCLLAHPGSFTTLLRPVDRDRALAAFLDRVPEPTEDRERDLRTAVLALQAENGGHGIELTAPPLVTAWSGGVDSGGAWLLRSQVDRVDRVPTWLQRGHVSLTVGRFRQLPEERTQASLAGLVEDLYADLPVVKREAKKRDVLAFVLGVQPGDLVATDEAGQLRLGRIQDGEATLESLGGTTLLVRPVVWADQPSAQIAELPGALRSRLRFKGEDVVNLTEVLDALEALEDREVEVDGPPGDEDGQPGQEELPETTKPPVEVVLTCDTAGLARELHHADDSWLVELLDSLNERRQVVLEGPPGTGKTYLVQKLLDACGLTDNERALVQFHPTYSYEDFVEGFRPSAAGEGGAQLTVVPGPLKRIAEEARNAPGRPYVLVIDEINRANIAKVFGELYFLLEYRDAEVELLYSDGKERFSLPRNLFLIGTMNTADRSIALLDAAMRRRFVFLSMDTTEPALGEVLARWCAANGLPGQVAELRDRLNAAMLRNGLEPALAFGPSYFMRQGLAAPAALDRLWRRELLPMLREHHYGDDARLASYRFQAWCADLGLTAPSAGASGVEDTLTAELAEPGADEVPVG